MDERGSLERTLSAGRFVVTAETSPPDAADPGAVLARVHALRGLVDAVNVTDGAGAMVHMSALATAAILARDGIEPVLQFTTRDRNRIALQADLLGAATLGIRNILCLRGDSVEAGDEPTATPVYDLDSVELLRTAHAMRDEGRYRSGRAIDQAPSLFIGAADSPREPGPDEDGAGVQAKIDAGADFFQTQYVFDLGILRRYMARLQDHGIPERTFFIIGIGPIASARAARWMNETLFGVHVPEAVIKRLESAADAKAEGRRMCLELLQQLPDIEGVHGAHLMGPRQEQAIAEIVAESGVREDREDEDVCALTGA